MQNATPLIVNCKVHKKFLGEHFYSKFGNYPKSSPTNCAKNSIKFCAHTCAVQENRIDGACALETTCSQGVLFLHLFLV
jgi:hypothetical protein